MVTRPTFWSRFEEFLAQSREQGQPRTAQASATAGRHLREFGQQAKVTIDFDAITPGLGDKFASYLLKIGQTDNTIAKQFVRLKRFMKWAADRGYHANAKYQRLTWQRHDPEILILTKEEVAAIEGLSLPAGGYLDNARALFLLACYTGLRYSDLVSIRPEHRASAPPCGMPGWDLLRFQRCSAPSRRLLPWPFAGTRSWPWMIASTRCRPRFRTCPARRCTAASNATASVACR